MEISGSFNLVLIKLDLLKSLSGGAVVEVCVDDVNPTNGMKIKRR